MDFREKETDYKSTLKRLRRNPTNIPTIETELITAIVGIDEIERIYPEEQTVLISITEPDSELIPDSIKMRYLHVHETKFWDVLDKVIGADGNEYDVIPMETARKIKEFILDNKDKKFVVHCKAGISRSAAVGCCIECLVEYEGDVYGYKTGHSSIKEFWRYHPNPTVFDRIMNS